MVSTTHDGLGAGELDVRVEALHHGAVAVARQRGTEIGQTEISVHLGVAAPIDVEGESLVGLFDHLDLEGAAFGPVFHRLGEVVEIIAPHSGCQLAALSLGNLDDNFPGQLIHALLAKLFAETFEQRRHDSGFDLTPLEHANIVEGVGLRICHIGPRLHSLSTQRRLVLLVAVETSSYAPLMDQICDDLAAEHSALDSLVANLTEEQWTTDTPAAGWDVKDTIVHLIQADMAASLAVTNANGFQAAKQKMQTSGGGGLDFFITSKGKTGEQILTTWRSERAKMLEAFRSREPKDRIPWFGPDMSTLSFATARLMETWSHGQDVADTLDQPWPSTDRLKHVCHIGVTTRGWSYVNRDMEFPGGDVRVELTAPSGTVWTWGPEEAPDRLTGPAEDFALVATQRRHPSDTALVAEGNLAAEWLGIAQAFAGPPTLPEGRKG